ncbi:MAG: prepilin-type N-terminal cleavage/methylation domain-containing protein [Alphaproteobacteria bacterium]
MRRRQQGFSLVELAIVLAVAGVVIGGVWAAVSSGSAKAKVVLATEQVIVLNKNIRGFYQRQACIAVIGDVTPALLAANPSAIPRDMILGGGAVSPWGQPFQVRRDLGAAGCGTNDAFRYVLQYQNLPPDACIGLVAKVTGPGELSRGLTRAAINGVALTALPPNVTAISGTAAGQCAENPTALVEFTYNLRAGE